MALHDPPRVLAFVETPSPNNNWNDIIVPFEESSSEYASPMSDPEIKEQKEPDNKKQKVLKLKPLPPASVLVEPFGGIKTPLESRGSAHSPDLSVHTSQNSEIITKPTCSLNLVCYSRGCSMSQIRVTVQTEAESEFLYKRRLAQNKALISTDQELFKELCQHYTKRICGVWRKRFSMKTLRRLRLLEYTANTRPSPVPMDEYTMHEVLYAYNHPSEFGTETDWIKWVFRLRQPDKRHALEFVEGWDGTRIAIVGLIPCIFSTLVGVIWSAKGGDVQTAFTVAGFILTVATVLLALFAVISGIDSNTQ